MKNKSDKKRNAHFQRIENKKKQQFLAEMKAFDSSFKLWQRFFGKSRKF